jgi:hypothetical protein
MYNPNADLTRKYLIQMKVLCGFVQLKIGLAESKRTILKTLEANCLQEVMDSLVRSQSPLHAN